MPNLKSGSVDGLLMTSLVSGRAGLREVLDDLAVALVAAEMTYAGVPWREELTTAVPAISDGKLTIPAGPGWGVDVNEDVLRQHPWTAGVR